MFRLAPFALALASSSALAADLEWSLPSTPCTGEGVIVVADGAVEIRGEEAIPFEGLLLAATAAIPLDLAASCVPAVHLVGVPLANVDPAGVRFDTPIPLADTPFETVGHLLQGTVADPAGGVTAATAIGTVTYRPIEMIARRERVSLRPLQEAVLIDVTLAPMAVRTADPDFIPELAWLEPAPEGFGTPDELDFCIEVWLRPEHPWCQHCEVDVPDTEPEGSQPFVDPFGPQCL